MLKARPPSTKYIRREASFCPCRSLSLHPMRFHSAGRRYRQAKNDQAERKKKHPPFSLYLRTPCTTKWSPFPVLIARISSGVLPISSGAMPTSMLFCTSCLSSSDSFFWTCEMSRVRRRYSTCGTRGIVPERTWLIEGSSDALAEGRAI